MTCSLDIIVCTYNRPYKVNELVNQFIPLRDCFNNFIVIDSSDDDNLVLKQNEHVIYLKSSHKNQPYQRYLGYLKSNADFILFLDDDMELTDKSIFFDILEKIEIENIVGIACNFKNKYSDTSLSKIPKSYNNFLPNWLGNFIRKLTLNHPPKRGFMNLFGLRGGQPDHLMETKLISGGAFIAKKEFLFKNFNFNLLNIFEKRIGMGEDTLIGYSLAKYGKILYYDNIAFLHNEGTGSNYSMDVCAYSKRVFFSRFFIARELARLDENYSKFKLVMISAIYLFFRLLGLLLGVLTKPSKVRLMLIKGAFLGVVEIFGFNSLSLIQANEFWLKEARKDIL